MFDSLSESLQSAFKSLSGRGKLSMSNIQEGLALVEKSLLEADVNYEVVDSFMKKVTEAAIGTKVLLALRPSEEFIKVVYENLVEILGPVDSSLKLESGKLKKVMLCGLQGAGKTTTCGKLAQFVKEEKLRPFLIAADLQRPAAIEQLHVIGRQLDVGVFSKLGATDPVEVCREGIRAAEAANANFVIIDTAGRLAIDAQLMAELKRIDQQISPDEVLLVVDGMTGQDAVRSASAFNEAITLNGVIMTKLDGDTRGGALLSVKAVTQVPIKFLGTGEQLDALEPFRPEGMASRILNMGDIYEVARQAHRLVDENERQTLEERLKKGKFGLIEFRLALEKFRNPGPLMKMMALIPGMSSITKLLDTKENEGNFRRTAGIIDSMTPAERDHPEIINIQRRTRIAKGCGVQASDINRLISDFNKMAGTMKAMFGGGGGQTAAMMQAMNGMSGMGNSAGMPGMLPTKQSTGKRLTPKEREKLARDREKAIRKAKRTK